MVFLLCFSSWFFRVSALAPGVGVAPRQAGRYPATKKRKKEKRLPLFLLPKTLDLNEGFLAGFSLRFELPGEIGDDDNLAVSKVCFDVGPDELDLGIRHILEKSLDLVYIL